MKKVIIKVFTVLFAFCFAVSASVTGTYAWNNEQHTINEGYADMVPVELVKLEKQDDDNADEIPIPNTAFYLYNKNGTQLGERYVTDKEGKIKISLPGGDYYFEEVSPAVGYTFDVDENGNQITRYDFTVDEPQKENTQDESKKDEEADKIAETVTVKAYNIRLKGSLIVRKSVENENGSPLTEEQKNTAFKFSITFSGNGNRYDHYEYSIDGGEKKIFSSGDSFWLSDGQSAIFEELPAGILYSVVEEPSEEYITESMGHRGNILEGETALAGFTNILRDADDTEPPEEGAVTTLSVTKRLEGKLVKSDLDKEFNIVLYISSNGKRTAEEFTLKADETKDFEIPIGAHYEVNEDNFFGDGFSQTTINGYGIAAERPISVIVINTYVGEERIEIGGTKTWNMKGHDNVKIPESITLELNDGDKLIKRTDVEPDDDGRWKYSFVVPKYRSDGSEAEYSLKELPIKSYKVSYITNDDSESNEANTTEDLENNINEKINLNNYKRVDIKNTYIAPISEKLPEIVKTVKGSNAPKSEFEFILKGSGVPMPEGSDGSEKHITIKGSGKAELGEIEFTEVGEYTYTITEVNGNESGWTYDSSVYTITFKVTERNNVLSCEKIINKNYQPADETEFVNTYHKSSPSSGRYATISGTKTWNHGDNPESKRPESIIVYLYGDGELVTQRLVTASDNWKYKFVMPKENKFGKKIIYTIDEADIADYDKEIKGYDIVNTYKKANGEYSETNKPSDRPDDNKPDNDNLDGNKPDKNPSASDKPAGDSLNKPNGGNTGKTDINGSSASHKGNKIPRTGDSMNLSFWILLMLFNMTGLSLVIVIAKTEADKYTGQRSETT